MQSIRKASRLQKTIVSLSILYAVVFIYMLIARPGSQKFYHAFFNVYQAIPPLFSAICGFIYFKRASDLPWSRRIGWLCIGLGCLSFALGQSIWTYYESIRGIDVPFPGGRMWVILALIRF